MILNCPSLAQGLRTSECLVDASSSLSSDCRMSESLCVFIGQIIMSKIVQKIFVYVIAD
jgi:hypothetical protein